MLNRDKHSLVSWGNVPDAVSIFHPLWVSTALQNSRAVFQRWTTFWNIYVGEFNYDNYLSEKIFLAMCNRRTKHKSQHSQNKSAVQLCSPRSQKIKKYKWIKIKMKQKEIDTLDFMAQCHEIGLKMDRSAIKDQELLITSRSDSLAPLIVRESDLTVLHLEKQQ